VPIIGGSGAHHRGVGCRTLIPVAAQLVQLRPASGRALRRSVYDVGSRGALRGSVLSCNRNWRAALPWTITLRPSSIPGAARPVRNLPRSCSSASTPIFISCVASEGSNSRASAAAAAGRAPGGVRDFPFGALAGAQGLAPVHFLAQRKRFLWDRECIQGLSRGSLRGVRGYQRMLRAYFVSACQKRLKLS